MLEQYWALKREVPDALLLYRLGDFYEFFFEDAEMAAPLLGLVLTARHRDTDVEAPMCGIPQHALDTYVAKLIAAGKKVAISEQVELPTKGRTLVERRIVRILTPGTLVDPERLDARKANEVASYAREGDRAAVASLELSAGEFTVVLLAAEAASEFLARRDPSELVVFAGEEEAARRDLALPLFGGPVLTVLPEGGPRGRTAAEALMKHFGTSTLEPFGLTGPGPEADAAAALLAYAKATQKSDCRHVASLRVEVPGDCLVVDAVTAGHLEVFQSQRNGRREGSLLDVLDRTGTAFGARTLRRWLERPAGNRSAIEARLDAVEDLASDGPRLDRLSRALSGIPDLPRLVSRLSVGAGSPRDLAGIAVAVRRGAEMSPLLAEATAALLQPGGEASVSLMPVDLAAELSRRFVDVPPASPRDGGLVRDGVDSLVDELRTLRRDASMLLGSVEADERAARGIPTLRVKFNQVFGHVFEVPASARARIPGDALKRQTLAQVERYATAPLVEVDERLRGADARLAELETEVFQRAVQEIVAGAPRLLEAAARLGRLDALVSLALVARSRRWCRPALADKPLLAVEGGRHPVVEAAATREPFVPNDCDLDADGRVVILTGPNMGGKSTWLRQNALIVLLAHVGSFVPADAATVGLCDRIFTRVGASDSLARGESTFFVEMAETAHILRQATRRSLVILDEVGRGTATFDGLSLAWAIAEYLHDGPGGDGGGPARVLFATHYHELTELALVKRGVRNRTMAVKEWDGDVVFLRKVVEGSADRSYGVQVARLAGIPERVLARAREILHNLERQQLDVGGRPRLAEHEAGRRDAGEAKEPEEEATQLDLFRGQGEVVLDNIGRLDLGEMTPLAALNLLASFQARLRGEK